MREQRAESREQRGERREQRAESSGGAALGLLAYERNQGQREREPLAP
jgi:hypothetical protein